MTGHPACPLDRDVCPAAHRCGKRASFCLPASCPAGSADPLLDMNAGSSIMTQLGGFDFHWPRRLRHHQTGSPDELGPRCPSSELLGCSEPFDQPPLGWSGHGSSVGRWDFDWVVGLRSPSEAREPCNGIINSRTPRRAESGEQEKSSAEGECLFELPADVLESQLALLLSKPGDGLDQAISLFTAEVHQDALSQPYGLLVSNQTSVSQCSSPLSAQIRRHHVTLAEWLESDLRNDLVFELQNFRQINLEDAGACWPVEHEGTRIEAGGEDDDLAATSLRGLKKVVVEVTRAHREVVLHAAGRSPARRCCRTRRRYKAPCQRVFKETIRSSSFFGPPLGHPQASDAFARRRAGTHVSQLSGHATNQVRRDDGQRGGERSVYGRPCGALAS